MTVGVAQMNSRIMSNDIFRAVDQSTIEIIVPVWLSYTVFIEYIHCTESTVQ